MPAFFGGFLIAQEICEVFSGGSKCPVVRAKCITNISQTCEIILLFVASRVIMWYVQDEKSSPDRGAMKGGCMDDIPNHKRTESDPLQRV